MGSRRIVFQGMEAPFSGLNWESENRLRIGRQPNQDIVLDHHSVSRQHAEVYCGRQGWSIRDVGSSSGTMVNGIRLGRDERKLQVQDIVHIGSVPIQVAAIEDEAPPTLVPREHQAQVKTSGEFLLRVQATAKRSWEKGLENLAEEGSGQVQRGKHFLTLLRGGYHFSNVATMDVMLQSVLDDTVAVLNAQRGAILLWDDRTGQLVERSLCVPRPKSVRGKSYSRTLSERCHNQGESLLCRDVKTDIQLQQAGSVLQGTMASIICALFRSPRRRLGVLHLDRGPLQPPFEEEDFMLADSIAASVSIGIETAQLLESLRDEYGRTVAALAATLERRAPYLAGHGERVASLAALLAEELGLNAVERRQVRSGAAIHDVGKLLLDDALLNRVGPLSADDLGRARAHALHGVALIEGAPTLAAVVPIVRNHHERWDGSGYPDRLAGDAIPRAARIVAVANAYDNWTHARPYRAAVPAADAFQRISADAAKAFDPGCVEAFLRLRPRIEGQPQPTP